MAEPFVHLRVASGYSMQYGASHPSDLVARAAELGMDILGLADRDGMYGAVRFAKACLRTGVSPVIGVDLAVADSLSPGSQRWPGQERPRTAAKGGSLRDPRLPRVVVLASSRAGWAALSRLTSRVHLSGERGAPIATPELIAEHAGGGDLVVLLGIDSSVGVALTRQDGQMAARAELHRWRDLIDPAHLVVAVSELLVGGLGSGSTHQATLMLGLADQTGLRAVLANPIRMAHRHQAPTCDVLDAARRLVALDERHIDRRNAEGWLKDSAAMTELAEQVCSATRRSGGGARLLADTRELAERCRLDPRADVGLGEIHLPEFDTLVPDARASPVSLAAVLRQRCEAGANIRYGSPDGTVVRRLDEELAVIGQLGFESYFLTVADVVDAIREMGIRCAARGSGAGSLVNYLLGISGVDPLAYGLIMERFLSPLRAALPDIDLDVESARRTEIYQRIFELYGGERVACLAMIETYRVRHAVRDVGAALSLVPSEIDAMAKAFPHIRARDARAALNDLPELRSAGLAEDRLDVLFGLVESLDGLPRHVALHPCGIILSDATLGDRTPLEASFGGFPMSQFDKDDVEDMGFLKLDVLGIRMQSSMAHALVEIERTEGTRPDIDALAPFDDPDTYDMIGQAQTLGCFQIESPGQRELVGKFGPSCFNDLAIDISLFRPGPVKSDMVVPFLNARQGWNEPQYLHPSLIPALAETCGVVVYHEQVIRIIAVVTGCSLAQGDEIRRALGDVEGRIQAKEWFWPRARLRGYELSDLERIWSVLESFASFGFCKAHAAAFALPTYQSAWLKRHYPAQFLAGLLTHDPGMYPKRLILEEARRMGIAILGLDVNRSDVSYRAELIDPDPIGEANIPLGLPDARGWGLRLALADVKGIATDEVLRIVAGQPYQSLSDFCGRADVNFPVVENLVLTGAFDQLYGIQLGLPRHRRSQITRRDLLLALADLRRVARVEERTASRARGLRTAALPAVAENADAHQLAQRQAKGEAIPARAKQRFTGVQLALDFTEPELIHDEDEVEPIPGIAADFVEDVAAGEFGLASAGNRRPTDVVPTGLPEMTHAEQLEAELEVVGMDASRHLMAASADFLAALGITHSTQLQGRRNHSELLVAGVKVATQTPPVRSGRRVVFLTVDDGTGPVDVTFFEDAQVGFAATVFSSWLLVVRGTLRRTGPHGVSLLATGCWDLQVLHRVWQDALAEHQDPELATEAVRAIIDTPPAGYDEAQDTGLPQRKQTDAQQRSGAPDHTRAGGMGPRRVLVHPTGFLQSPYADIKPAGVPANQPPRKLWHASPGSSGR